MNGARRLELSVVLGAAALVLAALLVFELLRTHGAGSPAARAIAVEPATPPAAWGDALPDPVDTSALTLRPLFSATRRAAAPDAPAAEPAQAPTTPTGRPPEWRLTGVVISGSERSAILHDVGTRRSFRLAEGESEAGWRVKTVGPDKVIIEHSGLEHELPLRPY